MTTAERFRLHRAGILNVWQYDEQEFRLAGGRLLLRGANGAGKSKTLEMLLPFVLDGDKARITASARHHTSLLWLMTDGYAGQARVGYLWVEFARTTAEGALESYTCGVGIRASASAKSATAWFFTTPLRVGEGLVLEDEAGPLSRPRLAERLGPDGQVFESPRQYKEHIGRTLFGLAPEQYDEVLRLLYWLRQPQVGEDIEPARLAGQLAQALPQLDDATLRAAGDTFDSLAAFGEELERRAAAAEALAALSASYTRYARSVVGSRGRAAVDAVQDERRARSELRRCESAVSTLDGQVAGLGEQSRETSLAMERDRARLDELRASPQALDQRRLAELTQRVSELRRDADNATRRVAAASERHQKHLQRVTRDGVGAATRLRGTSETSQSIERELAEAGVDTTLATAVELRLGALDDLPTSERLVGALQRFSQDIESGQGALGRRHAAVVVVRDACERVVVAQRLADDAQTRAAETEGRWEASLQRQTGARRAAEQAERDLWEGLRDWLSDPAAARVGLPADVPADLAPDSLAALPDAIRMAAKPALDHLRRAESESAVALDRAAEQRTVLSQRRAAVERERDPLLPEPALARRARPAHGEGAPLWRLVDFATGVDEKDEAGLEAALQASGLLDAWVTPDGSVLDAAEHETVLPVGSSVTGPALDQLLTPDCPPESGVSTAVVISVLRRVSVSPDHPVAGIDVDGRWSLGPLQGSAVKDHAQYIGATTRRLERQRRLKELDEQIARVQDEHQSATAAVEEVRREIAGLEAWVTRLPSAAPLSTARAVLQERDDALDRDGALNSAAQQAATQARSRLSGIRDEASRLARQHDLTTDTTGLAALDERLRGLGLRLHTLGDQVPGLVDGLRRWADDRHELDREGVEVSSAQSEAAGQQSGAEQHAAALEELEASVGASVRALQERLTRLASSVEHAGRRIAALGEEITDAVRAHAKAETGRDAAIAALERCWADRAAALNELGRLGEVAGLLDSAFAGAEAPPDRSVLAQAALQSADTAVPAPVSAVARAAAELEETAGTVDVNVVWSAYSDATRGPAADHEPRVVEMAGVLAVTARDEGGESPIGLLAPRVAAAVEHDRALLTEKEKTQFEQHILGELGEAVRRRRLEAEELVAAMNELLGGVSTSQGIRVRLDWRLRDDVPGEAREAMRLLSQPVGALIPEERATLRDALHRLIDASRVERPELSYSEHLAVALDYRAWFTFRIRYTRPEAAGAWLDLHRRSPLSQGEQKVLCYLPLFAAAAAHFTSLAGAAPFAPRLVLLDDAFPKIDVRTHPLLFGLLVQLDLDFVITSERLWGDHDTVPSLAIYEALRDPAQRGIAQFEYRWDGRQLQAVG